MSTSSSLLKRDSLVDRTRNIVARVRSSSHNDSNGSSSALHRRRSASTSSGRSGGGMRDKSKEKLVVKPPTKSTNKTTEKDDSVPIPTSLPVSTNNRKVALPAVAKHTTTTASTSSGESKLIDKNTGKGFQKGHQRVPSAEELIAAASNRNQHHTASHTIEEEDIAGWDTRGGGGGTDMCMYEAHDVDDVAGGEMKDYLDEEGGDLALDEETALLDDGGVDGMMDEEDENNDHSDEDGAPAAAGTVDPNLEAADTIQRERPVPEQRPLLGQYVHLCVSPFPHRAPTIAFVPQDRPVKGEPLCEEPDAYVHPQELKEIPCVTGKRKRIGRKKRYGNLLYNIPEGSVRFSSVLSIFGTSGFLETQTFTEPWSMRWCKRMEPEEYKALHPYQKVNHFPGTWGIGRKDNLHRRLYQHIKQFGREEFYFAPVGFLLPKEEKALRDDMAAKADPPPGKKNNVYIVKPVASACGRGIRLLSTGKVPRGLWLVQRYIHDPFLLHQYKFDLRIYVVVTSFDPLRMYRYEDGLVRFASSPYPGTGKSIQIKNKTAHLTNYSVNKLNPEGFVSPDDAGEEEFGSKWTFPTLKKYLSEKGIPWEPLWDSIEDVIIKTVISVEKDVVANLPKFFPYRTAVTNCFQLFGFDVLLRRNLAPVLMEVNIMPSLSSTCSLLDQRVKANMIADMLTLVGANAPQKKHKKRPSTLNDSFLDGLTNDQLDVVAATEEEFERRMHFKRLFPNPFPGQGWERYSHLFIAHRSRNQLLQDWLKYKRDSLKVESMFDFFNHGATTGSPCDGSGKAGMPSSSSSHPAATAADIGKKREVENAGEKGSNSVRFRTSVTGAGIERWPQNDEGDEEEEEE